MRRYREDKKKTRNEIKKRTPTENKNKENKGGKERGITRSFNAYGSKAGEKCFVNAGRYDDVYGDGFGESGHKDKK